MVIGIDEVGRGSLAGPLVVGAVSLSIKLIGLTDSKLLTNVKRQILAQEIYTLSDFSSLGWCWPDEIDRLGLTKATSLAIKRALIDLDTSSHELIIDGRVNFLPDQSNVTTIIKADVSVPAVSAASIIAKTARDKYMRDMSLYLPDYGFNQHVGYGTKYHISRLKILGPSPIHRISFKPLLIAKQS